MNTAKYTNCSYGGTYIEEVEVLDRRPWTEADKTQLERSLGFQGGKQPKWMYKIVSEGDTIWVKDSYLELPFFVGAM